MKRLTQIFQTLLGVVALMLTALIAIGRLVWRTTCNWWKNSSKWVRRSLATGFALAAAGFLAIVTYAIYKDQFGRDYYDQRLSESVVLHSFADNKVRVYNRRTQQYTTDKINWVSEVAGNDSLAVYALPNRRGFLNVSTGRIIIDAEANEYTKAWVFSDGLAAVMKDGKIGFINTSNNVVIPFQFEYAKWSKWRFDYVFHNGLCNMTNAEGYLGLIDTVGNWVVKPTYDDIWSPHSSGHRIVVKNSKYGIVNSSGSIIYPAEYNHIQIVSDGFVLTNNGKMWQVDFEGNVVNPFMFEATYYINYPNGYDDCSEIKYEFADYIKYRVGNNYGIMNRITGEPITPAIYSDINMLSKELFEVQEYDSYNWHLLDTKGNVVSRK